jgi:sialic acid synthase SpsE
MKSKNKVIIIAEIGPNHNGSFTKAKSMIKEISKIGVDVIKFQIGNPELVYSKESFKANYQKRFDNEKSIVKMSKKNQLSLSEHIKLYKYCKKLNVKYACSAFDLDSLKKLNKRINLPFFKIPSGEIHSIDMLKYMSQQKKKILLSTGMATIDEISSALKILKRHGNNNISLLHCVSSYPTKNEMLNLNFIDTLNSFFNLPVGLSDHSLSEMACVSAVSKGARIIEKHITTSKKLIGPDHKSSFTIPEFKKLVEKIREVEIILGSDDKKFSKDELNVKKVARKSIVAEKKIEKNKKIKYSDLTFKRPGTGISPIEIKSIIGKRAKITINKDRVIRKFFLK